MASRPTLIISLALLLSRVVSENPPLPAQQTPVHLDHNDVPKFGEPITNLTVPVGREAVLTCLVEDLGVYKVAWLRVDTQTILTIHGHVITKNHRIGVTHSDHRTWYLHIKDLKQSDRGWYMCQINTDPMKSQVGFLNVVVPPDILDYGTSTDMVVREGSNVSFRCAASGSPPPNITWRRESSEVIPLQNDKEATIIEGPEFNITRVNRLHMGAFLCIASNGVPPTVSKRIMLIVHFPPMIWIQNQLVGAMEGEQMTLECHSEAYPKSINYWTRETGEMISQGAKYVPVMLDNAYKVTMKLTIHSVSPSDFGSYKCLSKNSLGDTDGTIKLYQIPSPSTTTEATTVTTQQTVYIPPKTTAVPEVKLEKKRPKERKKIIEVHNEIPPIPDIRSGEASKTGRVKLIENRYESTMGRSQASNGDTIACPRILTAIILTIVLVLL